MYSSRTTHMIMQRQRGAAFIVMLVILIMGVTFYLVSALSKVTLQTARNEKSSDLLAQAKEVVIGYAVNGTGTSQRPGDMPYPDRLLVGTETPPDYDGTTDSCPALQVAPTPTGCLGRLPWLTLGMSIDSPSQNDPTGFMPWYAVSANLVDPTCVTVTSSCSSNPLKYGLNSEILNAAPPPHTWLTVRDMNGNILSSRVALVIIIPGAALPGQSRTASPNLGGANQYLDSITVPNGCTPPCVAGTYNNYDMDDDFIMGDEHRWINDPANPSQQIEDPNYHFNDKLLYVTIDDLMPLIEKRIAREAKKCLDDYAAMPVVTNGNQPGMKYPWATPVSDTTYTGTINTLFGRVSSTPNTSTSGSGNAAATTLQNALNALQTALDNYFAAGNATNRTILINSGNYVISLKNTIPSPPAPTGFSNTIDTAGDWAVEFASGMHTYSGVSGKITTALSAVTPLASNSDLSMSASWPLSCTLFTTSTYWVDWQSLVFFQLADGYKPGTATPSCGTSCLTINGSGNPNSGNGSYRAAVIVAGKKLGTQTRPSYTNPPTDYLSSSNATLEKSSDPAFATVINAHDNAALTTSFITYKPSDPYYQNVNDLVLCLDGKGININSVCP